MTGYEMRISDWSSDVGSSDLLRLQPHVHAVGDVVGHQRRQADAKVDVHAVLKLTGGALRHLFAGPGHHFTSWRTVRCSMRFSGVGLCTMRSTQLPGRCTWSGSRAPLSTKLGRATSEARECQNV